jgi:queuine tRNA-ribosyltransferase
MTFKIIKKSKNSRARRGVIQIRGKTIKTPFFMPCATVGAVKTMSTYEVGLLGFEALIANTYHLYLRPGEKFIKKAGGIGKWMGWKGAVVTDSGGYQVFSLGAGKRDDKAQLVKITDNGVEFRSHLDGSKHIFTPEKVIDIQLTLGSDIIMPLDFCPSANAKEKEIERAVDLTNKWFARAWTHFQKRTKNQKNKPALFAIIHGGAIKRLREKSYQFLSQFPVDGFAIGGVANAGESKLKQKAALKYTVPLLPEDKPRYLMGVGEPQDLKFAIENGIDMFDCVLPTRLARHGVVWVNQNSKIKNQNDKLKIKKIDLRKSSSKHDLKPIDENCRCLACSQKLSRSYLSHLIREREVLGIRLLSHHNLYFIARFIDTLR